MINQLGIEAMNAAVEAICRAPESFDMRDWASKPAEAACGTANCLAGHMLRYAGYVADWPTEAAVGGSCTGTYWFRMQTADSTAVSIYDLFKDLFDVSVDEWVFHHSNWPASLALSAQVPAVAEAVRRYLAGEMGTGNPDDITAEVSTAA